MVSTFAGQWQGPFKGERGGQYWISPSGEKSYEGPQGDGGDGSPGGGAQALAHPDAERHAAESSRIWGESTAGSGVDAKTSATIHSGLQSIASESNPEHQASRLKSFALAIASLPVEAVKPLVQSLFEFGKQILKVGARGVGAVGLQVGGLAIAAGIIAASTALPALVPASLPAWSALLAAYPIGVGIKKLLTATSKAGGRILRGNTTPGVRYSSETGGVAFDFGSVVNSAVRLAEWSVDVFDEIDRMAEWTPYTHPKTGAKGAKSSGGRVVYGDMAKKVLAGNGNKKDDGNKPSEGTIARNGIRPSQANGPTPENKKYGTMTLDEYKASIRANPGDIPPFMLNDAALEWAHKKHVAALNAAGTSPSPAVKVDGKGKPEPQQKPSLEEKFPPRLIANASTRKRRMDAARQAATDALNDLSVEWEIKQARYKAAVEEFDRWDKAMTPKQAETRRAQIRREVDRLHARNDVPWEKRLPIINELSAEFDSIDPRGRAKVHSESGE